MKVIPVSWLPSLPVVGCTFFNFVKVEITMEFLILGVGLSQPNSSCIYLHLVSCYYLLIKIKCRHLMNLWLLMLNGHAKAPNLASLLHLQDGLALMTSNHLLSLFLYRKKRKQLWQCCNCSTKH